VNPIRLIKTVGLLALIGFLISIPSWTSNPYYLHIVTTIFFTTILTASLRFIMNIGQLSLAHAAFVGIGAYTSAVLVKTLGFSFWLALPLAGLVGAFIGVLIGYATLRIKGAYFILVTFGLIEIFRIIFTNFWRPLFGGAMGIVGVPAPVIRLPFLNPIVFSSKVPYYYLALCLSVFSLWVMYRIEKSALGKVFFSIKQADHLVEAVGVNLMKYKVMAFTVGCFFAGVTGSFYAHYYSNISPLNFTMWYSVDILIAVIIGGAASFSGPVLGAAVLAFFTEALSSLRNYQTLVFGIVLVVTILFAPQGIMGLYPKLNSLFKKKTSLAKNISDKG
jgi:branched-chain amino acid transport system permease protein